MHQLLVERDFRRSSGMIRPSSQRSNMRNSSAPAVLSAAPAPAQHRIRFGKALRDDLLRAPDRGCPAGQSAVGGRQQTRLGTTLTADPLSDPRSFGAMLSA